MVIVISVLVFVVAAVPSVRACKTYSFHFSSLSTENNILVEFGVKYRNREREKIITKPPAANHINISGTTELI